MKKNNLLQEFATRLRDTLIFAGYQSSRAASGVDIHRFSEMTGHSPQICRKYLRGETIPELTKLADIAAKLNVSPGWLLFGDSHTNHPAEENKITISKPLLLYIFTHANALYHTEHLNESTVSQFLLGLTQDISQIDASDEQSKKIIDLALFSAHHFQSSAV